MDEYAPDPAVKAVVAKAEAKEAKKEAKVDKKVAEKLAIAKETKKQLKKEAAKKTGAEGNKAAKLSIIKTAAEVKVLQKEAAAQAKIAEKYTLKAKPHELKSKKLGENMSTPMHTLSLPWKAVKRIVEPWRGCCRLAHP